MRLLIIIVLIVNSGILLGQDETKSVHDMRIPKNLEQCFKKLGETLSDEELEIIKTFPEDSIYFHEEFKYGTDFFHAWKLYDGSRLTRFFNRKGLNGSHEIYNTILISYHRHLNNKPIDLDGQISKYQAKQKDDYEEYLKRTLKDTINGVYIPVNLEDCFKSLNEVLKKEDIETIKNLKSRTEVIQYHHGLGTWLRNNWGLWGGSRLQQYLIKKGLNHPDDMSHSILEFYYDWLNNNHLDWKKFEEE
jgi:hypothetical protein